MTKHVIIAIVGNDATALNATAQRIVNTMNNVATWVNANQQGKVDSITSTTRDVTVATTRSEFTKDGSGNLVIVP